MDLAPAIQVKDEPLTEVKTEHSLPLLGSTIYSNEVKKEPKQQVESSEPPSSDEETPVLERQDIAPPPEYSSSEESSSDDLPITVAKRRRITSEEDTSALLRDFKAYQDSVRNTSKQSTSTTETLSKNTDNGNKFKCKVPECPFRTSNSGALKKHEMNHRHQKVTKGLNFCPHCSYKCTGSKGYTAHLMLHVNGFSNTNDDLNSQSEVDSPMSQSDSESDVDDRFEESNFPPTQPFVEYLKYDKNLRRCFYQCKECEFKHFHQLLFAKHLEKHKEEQCLLCDFNGTPDKMVIHKKSHEAQKPLFKCMVCPFKTNERTELQEHMRDKHNIFLPGVTRNVSSAPATKIVTENSTVIKDLEVKDNQKECNKSDENSKERGMFADHSETSGHSSSDESDSRSCNTPTQELNISPNPEVVSPEEPMNKIPTNSKNSLTDRFLNEKSVKDPTEQLGKISIRITSNSTSQHNELIKATLLEEIMKSLESRQNKSVDEKNDMIEVSKNVAEPSIDSNRPEQLKETEVASNSNDHIIAEQLNEPEPVKSSKQKNNQCVNVGTTKSNEENVGDIAFDNAVPDLSEEIKEDLQEPQDNSDSLNEISKTDKLTDSTNVEDTQALEESTNENADDIGLIVNKARKENLSQIDSAGYKNESCQANIISDQDSNKPRSSILSSDTCNDQSKNEESHRTIQNLDSHVNVNNMDSVDDEIIEDSTSRKRKYPELDRNKEGAAESCNKKDKTSCALDDNNEKDEQQAHQEEHNASSIAESVTCTEKAANVSETNNTEFVRIDSASNLNNNSVIFNDATSKHFSNESNQNTDALVSIEGAVCPGISVSESSSAEIGKMENVCSSDLDNESVIISKEFLNDPSQEKNINIIEKQLSKSIQANKEAVTVDSNIRNLFEGGNTEINKAAEGSIKNPSNNESPIQSNFIVAEENCLEDINKIKELGPYNKKAVAQYKNLSKTSNTKINKIETPTLNNDSPNEVCQKTNINKETSTKYSVSMRETVSCNVNGPEINKIIEIPNANPSDVIKGIRNLPKELNQEINVIKSSNTESAVCIQDAIAGPSNCKSKHFIQERGRGEHFTKEKIQEKVMHPHETCLADKEEQTNNKQKQEKNTILDKTCEPHGYFNKAPIQEKAFASDTTTNKSVNSVIVNGTSKEHLAKTNTEVSLSTDNICERTYTSKSKKHINYTDKQPNVPQNSVKNLTSLNVDNNLFTADLINENLYHKFLNGFDDSSFFCSMFDELIGQGEERGSKESNPVKPDETTQSEENVINIFDDLIEEFDPPGDLLVNNTNATIDLQETSETKENTCINTDIYDTFHLLNKDIIYLPENWMKNHVKSMFDELIGQSEESGSKESNPVKPNEPTQTEENVINIFDDLIEEFDPPGDLFVSNTNATIDLQETSQTKENTCINTDIYDTFHLLNKDIIYLPENWMKNHDVEYYHENDHITTVGPNEINNCIIENVTEPETPTETNQINKHVPPKDRNINNTQTVSNQHSISHRSKTVRGKGLSPKEMIELKKNVEVPQGNIVSSFRDHVDEAIRNCSSFVRVTYSGGSKVIYQKERGTTNQRITIVHINPTRNKPASNRQMASDASPSSDNEVRTTTVSPNEPRFIEKLTPTLPRITQDTYSSVFPKSPVFTLKAKKGIGESRCTLCPAKISGGPNRLKQHLADHQPGARGIKCPCCTFRNGKSEIFNHIFIHVTFVDADKWICPICKAERRTKSGLNDHVKVEHLVDICKKHDAVCASKYCKGRCRVL
ncbi:putative uncharacterized protein DDB_G0282133 isoform X2 [Anthonomus grandis grandis]|uniref:putative uncharacterized protein DDB_G0282133 isoform X2 n=1 Tax=Anthonomus grandis grandis TaxID=2921223 RepID=UPI0021655D90|nr:putative uncharacterized protein DDB_G0282133 isoform X2 [Anthonomus grandis grandis]